MRLIGEQSVDTIAFWIESQQGQGSTLFVTLPVQGLAEAFSIADARACRFR